MQLTRGRPYKKDDNAHVEQKNWTHVRRLVGWERIDTAQAVELLNELYRNEWRWMMNLFQPSVKLLRKERTGARVRRVYDTPATPLDRLLRDNQGDAARLAELVARRDRLDPFTLSDRIEHMIARVHQAARHTAQPATSTSAALGKQRLSTTHPLLSPPPQGGGRKTEASMPPSKKPSVRSSVARQYPVRSDSYLTRQGARPSPVRRPERRRLYSAP